MSEGSQSHTRLPSQEHLFQEEVSPQYLVVKIRQHSLCVRWRAARNPGVCLKGPHRLTCSQTLTRSSSEVTAAGKASELYGEKINLLLQGEGWRDGHHYCCVEPFPTLGPSGHQI